jgi:hypothetical protein
MRKEKTAMKGLKFEPGEVYITPGAATALAESDQPITEFLNRYLVGDWGEVPEEDRDANRDGQGWCMSAYRTNRQEKIWIITEHDHSVTTILLPKEY